MLKRRIIASMAAVFAAVNVSSVCSYAATMPASFSVSTYTVEKAIETKNGQVIPAGSTAITVNINADTDFIAAQYQLHIEDGSLITDDYGNPIVSSDDSYDFAVSQNNLEIYIAGIATKDTTDDSCNVTLYSSNMPSALIVVDSEVFDDTSEIESFTSTLPSHTISNTSKLNSMEKSSMYMAVFGDATCDGVVSLEDAVTLQNALTTGYNNSWGVHLNAPYERTFMLESVFEAHINTLLSTTIDQNAHIIVKAETLNCNNTATSPDYLIMNAPSDTSISEVHQILQYYTDQLAYKVYNNPGWRIGEMAFFTIEDTE